MAENCPDLQSLHIEESYQLTDGAVIKLAALCPQLKELVLGQRSETNTWPVMVTEQVIPRLAEGCRHLQKLRIDNCEFVDKAIPMIAKCCPDLHKKSPLHSLILQMKTLGFW